MTQNTPMHLPAWFQCFKANPAIMDCHLRRLVMDDVFVERNVRIFMRKMASRWKPNAEATETITLSHSGTREQIHEWFLENLHRYRIGRKYKTGHGLQAITYPLRNLATDNTIPSLARLRVYRKDLEISSRRSRRDRKAKYRCNQHSDARLLQDMRQKTPYPGVIPLHASQRLSESWKVALYRELVSLEELHRETIINTYAFNRYNNSNDLKGLLEQARWHQ